MCSGVTVRCVEKTRKRANRSRGIIVAYLPQQVSLWLDKSSRHKEDLS